VNEDIRRLADAAQAGSRRAIARAITLVEAGGARARALQVALAERAPQPGATRIGFTGPPGAGKSTLVNRVIERYLSSGRKVGAIAVDPSSPFSGGAILGDRIRMDAVTGAENVFFRSLGSRGAVGGLSNACAGAASVLAACGYDPIILETVGVGQSEVEIARLADIVVVVMAPGMGDEIQSIKAGILEIGDIYAVNKSDLPGADRTAHELAAALDAPVLRVSALSGDGIDALAEALDARIAAMPAERRFRKEIPNMTSTKIDHIGVAVNSIEASLAFYEEILGIKVQGTETVAEQKVNVAFLPCGDSEIELLESTEPDGPVARHIEKNGEGVQHIAIRVENIEQALAELKGKGVRLIDESPRYGAGGARIAFVHPKATHGVLLELCERD
jgi:LAO/AO transport system kinase